MNKVVRVIFSTVILTIFYYIWTRTGNINNLIVTASLAFLVSLIYSNYLRSPILHPKKLVYALFYVFYLFYEIIKANIDVA